MSFPFTLQYKTEMTKPLQKTNIGGFFGTGNVNAHVFEIELMERGNPLSLSGSAVVEGAFVNYTDNSTVLLQGDVQNGKAVLTLSEGCYLLHGLFCVTVDVDGVTVFAGESILSKTKTDTIYDPDKTIPSLSEVLSQIEAARQAATAANEAADKANLAADAASGAAYSIDNMIANAETGLPGTNASVTVENDDDGKKVISFVIPRGERGYDNIVKGSAFESVEALQAGVVDPREGDQYNVGAAAPYNVYRWTGSAWEDQGKTQGVAGVGIASIEQTTTSTEAGGENVITVSKTDGSSSSFTVRNGSQGPQGVGIESVEQTASSDESGGENVYTITLTDGSTSSFTVKNGEEGRVSFGGEVYEIVPFITAASYSKDATFITQAPFDTTAMYFGRVGYMGTGISPVGGNATDGYEIRSFSVAISSAGSAKMNVWTAILKFTAEGATSGKLTHIALNALNSNAVASSTPTSCNLGPFYMMRKIAEEE